MKELLKKTAELLESGEDAVLVTIIASSGSTPRGSGARMLVGKNGRIAGTVGGGMVEYRSEQMALETLRDKSSLAHDFNLERNDVEDLGMICGGDVTVYFLYLDHAGRGAALARMGEKLLAENRDVWIITDVGGGGLFGFYTREEGFAGIEDIPEAVPLMTRRPIQTEIGSRKLYIEQLSSSGVVYVFGGGHVGQELVPVLSHVGFRCVVLDDRPAFVSRELFPTAEDTRLVDFDDIYKSVEINASDYVVIMTRGHAFDCAVERQVLYSPARYIGVIGSARKTAGVNKILKEAGITDEQLARITTPIGLAIHAETPAEIAISIAAQMIAVRSGKA